MRPFTHRPCAHAPIAHVTIRSCAFFVTNPTKHHRTIMLWDFGLKIYCIQTTDEKQEKHEEIEKEAHLRPSATKGILIEER